MSSTSIRTAPLPAGHRYPPGWTSAPRPGCSTSPATRPARPCCWRPTSDQGTRELTRLGADGTPTWTRSAPFAAAERLLYRGGPIGYITDGQGRVGEIDLTTGDLRQVIAWRDGAGQIFVGRDLLFFVHLDDRSQQWGVSAVGALGEPGWSVDGRPELERLAPAPDRR